MHNLKGTGEEDSIDTKALFFVCYALIPPLKQTGDGDSISSVRCSCLSGLLFPAFLLLNVCHAFRSGHPSFVPIQSLTKQGRGGLGRGAGQGRHLDPRGGPNGESDDGDATLVVVNGFTYTKAKGGQETLLRRHITR